MKLLLPRLMTTTSTAAPRVMVPIVDHNHTAFDDPAIDGVLARTLHANSTLRAAVVPGFSPLLHR